MLYALAGFVLLVVSGLLLDAHTRRWRRQRDELEGQSDATALRTRRAAQGQYRRRMQASGTVGAMGLLLGCRPFVPPSPLAAIIYIALLLLGCLWLVLLAIADAWSGVVRINNQRSQFESARVQLEAELRRAEARRDEQRQVD